MEQNVAILIKSDPEKTHRPVEAVRIALGLLSGDHQVRVILMGKAPLLLGETAEDLVDGEDLEKYLPPFKDLDQTFYVDSATYQRLKLEDCDYSVSPVTPQEIADMIAKADRHLIF
jgi:sulfur relay (sulfurtransferase) DsrF/TusC family protein